jgi:nucleoside-diphosphate-sugar epimerase
MDDYNRLPEIWPGGEPDVFYHLAWEGATGPGRADEALQSKNAARTLEAIKAAKAIGSKKFVAAGTVYENLSGQISADAEFRNAAYYLLSKRYARDMGRQLAFRLAIDFCWCTFCHPVGQHMKPEQLFPYVVNSLRSGNPPVFGAAMEPFDIIAVEDLVNGLYLAGAVKLSKTDYFIGSGKPRIMRDYLETIRDVLKTETPVIYNGKPDDGMRFNMEWFDIGPFVKETGYMPRLGFEEMVKSQRKYLLSE